MGEKYSKVQMRLNSEADFSSCTWKQRQVTYTEENTNPQNH